MKVPKLARYNGAVENAYQFVNDYITEFPIDLFRLIKKFKWGLLTYEEMAVKNNCTINDICECLGTDGYSIYNGNNYTIAYNNAIKSHGRINFTLAHEIGHIILNHHKDFEVTEVIKDNFTKEEYKILEYEANCFARNMLAPSPLVNQLSFWNLIFDVPNFFEITHRAFSVRMRFLAEDLNYLNDEQMSRMCNSFLRFKICPKCKSHTTDLTDIYCEICGNKLITGDGFKMKKYNSLYVLTQCPNCENVDIYAEDMYCIICGQSLKNCCTVCNNPLPNKARYCNKCGGKSSFFNSGELASIKYTDGVVLTPDEEMTYKNWKIILMNLKQAGNIALYVSLINSNLCVIDNNTVRNQF